MAELGRQVKYGLGTTTTPSRWINQLSFDLNPRSEYVNNNSAWGVIERTNSSDINRKWMEGSLEAKFGIDSAPLFLLGAYGSISSAANADVSGLVYDHTLNINQNILGQPLYLVRKDSLSTMRYLARFGEWQMTMSLDDYIRFTANVMGGLGTTATATPAYTAEAEFLAKNFTVKAVNFGVDLASATALTSVESFTLTVNPNLEADNEAGREDPVTFSSRGFEASFEMTCRYNDQIFENAYNNGTDMAMQLTLINNAVTIGTAAKPKLVTTAPKFNITDWTRSGDLDAPMTQTMTGTIHYSPTNAYMIRSVVTNTTSNY